MNKICVYISFSIDIYIKPKPKNIKNLTFFLFNHYYNYYLLCVKYIHTIPEYM
jgi:hypothetical protein